MIGRFDHIHPQAFHWTAPKGNTAPIYRGTCPLLRGIVRPSSDVRVARSCRAAWPRGNHRAEGRIDRHASASLAAARVCISGLG